MRDNFQEDLYFSRVGMQNCLSFSLLIKFESQCSMHRLSILKQGLHRTN